MNIRISILSFLALVCLGLMIYDFSINPTTSKPIVAEETSTEPMTGQWSQDTFEYQGDKEPTINLDVHEDQIITVTIYRTYEGERERVVKRDYITHPERNLSLTFPELWNVGTYEAESNADGETIELGTMKIIEY